MNRVAKAVLRAFAGSLLTVATVFGAGFGLVVVLGLSFHHSPLLATTHGYAQVRRSVRPGAI
jgi:hypothetical protein